MNSASAKRIDIISDTHGYLSPALLDELKGADLIIHAGDLTSEMDYEHLRTIAPVRAVLGNNDYYRDYGPCEPLGALYLRRPQVRRSPLPRRPPGGIRGRSYQRSHPRNQRSPSGSLPVSNPGSASYPRGTRGPTMARMLVKDGKILSTKFIDLE